jgi:hypothetical protein
MGPDQTPMRQRRIDIGFGWLAVCHEDREPSGMLRWLVSAIHPEIMRWSPTDGLPFTSRADHAPYACPYAVADDNGVAAAVDRLRRLVNPGEASAPTHALAEDCTEATVAPANVRMTKQRALSTAKTFLRRYGNDESWIDGSADFVANGLADLLFDVVHVRFSEERS